MNGKKPMDMNHRRTGSFSFFCFASEAARPLRDLADEMESIAQLQLAGVSKTEEEEVARRTREFSIFFWRFLITKKKIIKRKTKAMNEMKHGSF